MHHELTSTSQWSVSIFMQSAFEFEILHEFMIYVPRAGPMRGARPAPSECQVYFYKFVTSWLSISGL